MLSEKVKQGIKDVYGESQYEMQVERYESIASTFEKDFGKDYIFVSSPGRIEICGNHTDHQHGRVLGAAIDLDTVSAVKATGDDKVVVDSLGYSPVAFSSEKLDKRDEEIGTSTALTKGVMKYLKDKGYKVGGFVAKTQSRVFKGAGVSSSASYEVLIGKIISVLFNDDKISPMELIFAGHFAETEYFGKPCGLLDQSMIALGGVNYMDFLNPENPEIENMKPDFSEYGIMLINTGGDHSDLTHCYADVKTEMNSVAKYFGHEVLREVDEKEFFDSLGELSKNVSGRAILRAEHFFSENQRVKVAAEGLKSGNKEIFFDCLNASGDSSYRLLQNCYVGGEVAQRIPLALFMASKMQGVKARRVHGGGFAGTVLIIAEKQGLENLKQKAVSVFGDENVYCLNIRNYGAVSF